MSAPTELRFRKKPVEIEAFQMTKERRMDNSEWPNWPHEMTPGRRTGSMKTTDDKDILSALSQPHPTPIGQAVAAEERRSAELLKRLDKAREGAEPDYCYDPDEWEFTSSWDERDQVHSYGENLPLGGVMEVATLIRGPRKWVANVPVTWDENGDPDDSEIQWFDTEEEAEAALAHGGRS